MGDENGGQTTVLYRVEMFSRAKNRGLSPIFPIFHWEADSKGTPRVWRRAARTKLRASIEACKDWLKANRHRPLGVLLATLAREVRGHYNYFRAVGNGRALCRSDKEVTRLLYKWLNRRSQRRSLTWPKLKRLLERVAFPRPSVAAGKV